MIKEAISKVVTGDDLTEAEIEGAMEEIMSGDATSAQIGAFITALRIKGETVDEIASAAKVMRSKAANIEMENHEEPLLDTCGTGGDGTNTFNVSTATAFVAAGAGVRVAKHGNRAVSSQCGSADVLEALGVKLDVSHADVKECLLQVGIGFLFAPTFHKAMKYAAGPRKEIGLRTIFNVLGPLTNPAGATSQVLGVYDPDLTERLALVLGKLGTDQALVVCGEGVYDEISICSPTRISHLKEGQVQNFTISPEQYGFDRAAPETIQGGNAEQNAAIIRDILDGQRGPRRDMVLLNGAAAFVASGLDSDFEGGIERARDSIDSGKAKDRLDSLIQFTDKCAASG